MVLSLLVPASLCCRLVTFMWRFDQFSLCSAHIFQQHLSSCNGRAVPGCLLVKVYSLILAHRPVHLIGCWCKYVMKGYTKDTMAGTVQIPATCLIDQMSAQVGLIFNSANYKSFFKDV